MPKKNKPLIKYSISILIISLALISCIYEPPPVFYHFKITNNSTNKLNIESITIDNEVIQNDSVFKGSSFEKKILMLHCYKDYYKDSLINVFFKKLKVSSNKKLEIDFFNRKNWKESIILKNNNYCSAGDANYELIINDKDFK